MALTKEHHNTQMLNEVPVIEKHRNCIQRLFRNRNACTSYSYTVVWSSNSIAGHSLLLLYG